MGRRTPTRAAAVRTQRDRREIRRQRRRVAARRASRRQSIVERMQRSTVKWTVGDALAREFRTVADADDDRTSLAQTRDADGIFRSHMISVEARALSNVAASNPNVVLHDHEHASEGHVFATLLAPSNVARLSARLLGFEVNEGIQRRIGLLDTCDEGLSHLDGVELGRIHGRSDVTGAHTQHRMISSKLRANPENGRQSDGR